MQCGRIVAAAQEERFSRIKNDKAFPTAAFRYCLDQAGLTIADIECVAFYEDPCLKLSRQIWMGMLPGLTQQRRASILSRTLWTRPETEIRLLTGYDGPIEIVDHHLSHAASAYFFSGFEEAAILTIDGVGEWPTTTYNLGNGAEIERLEQVDFPDSLGLFYSAITGYLGFEVNEGEYKVMGLAPYGQPKYVKEIRQLIEAGRGGKRLEDTEHKLAPPAANIEHRTWFAPGEPIDEPGGPGLRQRPMEGMPGQARRQVSISHMTAR